MMLSNRQNRCHVSEDSAFSMESQWLITDMFVALQLRAGCWGSSEFSTFLGFKEQAA